MNGKPEPVGGAPSLSDQRQIFGREGVMPHDRRRLCRRIEQRRARLRREDFVLLHGGPFRLRKRSFAQQPGARAAT